MRTERDHHLTRRQKPVRARDFDPTGEHHGGLPTYPWRMAPANEGLATRRQLRALGLRIGGQPIAAQILCRNGRRNAYLYRIDLAKPVRPMTLGKEAALDKAMAARQTCPRCSRRYFTCLPLKTLGNCLECHDGTPADPRTYIAPPAKHRLAA
ncbi:RRQRL motif-containing zinc-binding protein [Streptomyces platensis]|uniref:RRQRL motif-containing zinc-binding protein n=1 Tax=Streptomyces platensis TaxID=58346 RepID=UPI00379FD27C